MSLQLGKASRHQIIKRDRACVVCGVPQETTLLAVYQFRPGDSAAHGVRICGSCRAAIDRREVGVSGLAPDDVRVVDGREEAEGEWTTGL